MKVEVSFNNHYYPWTEITTDGGRCWLKGTVFYKNKILQSDDVVRLISSILNDSQIDHETLKAHLLALNGNFALAMETSRYIFCTVDRVRSTPLFYAVSRDGALFSDDANCLRERLDPPFNEENGAEFLVTGYVTGSDTLFDGISQLQAGEYLVYDKRDGSLITSFYHRFWHGNFFLDSEEDLLNRLDETFVRVFQRLIESTNGRQIVVPLSGGLDSRIIVAMLKRLGVEDVICFTYGKKGNREAEISRRVAEALGYQWYFVEYTREKWYDCYHSEEMQEYLRYGGNLVSIPVIQDFLAVKELKEEGKIPENAVFVPGHSGDMLAGSHIPHDYDQPQSYTFEKFQEDSLKKHYNFWEWEGAELGSLFRDKIGKSVGGISVYDDECCANAIELFDFNERQAKYIVNSVRAYEFFGYRWQVPLWDGELIDFFLSVPITYRLSQELYKLYADDMLFSGGLQILSEIDCTTNISDNSMGKKRFPSHLADILSNYWDNIFDIRWCRYSRFPILFRLCGYRGFNQYNKGGLLYDILKYNKRRAFVPSLGGVQTNIYLKKMLAESQ